MSATATRPTETAIPAVSVVIPLYNSAAYVGECLESLMAQTFGDFEALCVDDGSTDGSLDVARAVARHDERFFFDSLPENRGQSAARNVALNRARGEYLMLLDSDDYLVPDALEKLIARMRAQQLDDLYFSARSFYESQELHELVREDFSERPSFDDVATGCELFAFFEERGQFFPQGALRMVRRDLVEEHCIRFREGIIHEDVLFTFQTLAESKRSSFLNEPVYRRRIRAGSTMTSPKRTIANVRGHFECVQEMDRWLHEHVEELDERFVRAVAHRMADYRLLAARDWYHDIDEAERERYLATLSAEDRLAFYEDVLQPGAVVERIGEEFYSSITYRLGNTILRVPRSIRNRVAEALRFRRER